MGGIWLWARAVARQHLGSTIALGLVVAVAGGVVLAAVAGASRTREALPTFVDRFRAEDLLVYSQGSLDEQTEFVHQLAGVPGVAAATGDAFAVFAATDEAGRPERGQASAVFGIVGVTDGLFRTIQVPKLVAGRLPNVDEPLEALVNEAFAEAHGVGPGDRMTVVAYRPDQLEAVANGEQEAAAGDPFEFHITGVARQPGDVSIQQSNDVDQALALGPAFWAQHKDDIANYGVEAAVRTDDGSSLDEVEAAISDRFPDVAIERSQGSISTFAATQRAINLQASALVATAAAFAVLTAALIGQSLVRRRAAAAEDDHLLTALGWSRREHRISALVDVLPVAVFGALGAVGVAVAMSPLFPIGTARAAELDPGVDVDGMALGLGALVVGAFVIAVTMLAGRRAYRSGRAAEQDPLSRRLAALGAPPTAVLALSLPLQRRQRPTTATALLASVLAVAAVAAGVVLATNLDDLVAHPSSWGETWDVTVGIYADPDSAQEGIAPLQANPAVGAFSGSTSATYSGDTVVLDGRVVGAVGIERLKGDLAPVVLSGRLPEADDEVALGRRTLAAIDRQVGDEVEVANPAGDSVTARITGEVLVPAALAPDARIGDGAIVPPATLDSLRPGNDFAALYLVRFAEGVSTADGIASLRPDFGDSIERATVPADIESIDRVRGLPWLLAGLTAALAAATVLHALVISVRRQRHDLAVLKAIGVGRRQLRRVGVLQASVFALVAGAIGVPLGLVLGRQVWQAVVDGLGLGLGVITPAAVLLAVPAAVVAGNLLAALPTMAAARVDPASALRAD